MAKNDRPKIVSLNRLGKYYILVSDNNGKRYEKKNFLKKNTSSNVEEPIIRSDAKRGTLYEIAQKAQ